MLFLYYNRILFFAAVIPAVVLLVLVYKKDRLDKESPQLLLSLVIRGVLATIIAMILERIGSLILNRIFVSASLGYYAVMFFCIVGVAEEGAKFFLLKHRTWNEPEFNCQFDGVVYAVFVSLGFALWENISYVFMYGLSTAMVRAVTAVPGHACFGVFMGVFYGLAKRYENIRDHSKSRLCLILACVVPVLLHGMYDFLATLQDTAYGWIFVPFVIVLFIISWRLVSVMSEKDRYI